MSRSAAVLLSVSLLLAIPALAQNADLGISIKAASTYNAGEISTLTATVTNYGPDTASVAGVRLANPSNKYLFAEKFGCIQMPDSVLCNVPMLEAGKSQVFTVPFAAPPAAGPITLSARTESWTVDPNAANNSAVATADVVAMPDLHAELSAYPGLQPGKVTRVRLFVSNLASTPATHVVATVTFPPNLGVPASSDVYRLCERVSENVYRCVVSTQVNQTQTLAVYFDVIPPIGAPDHLTFAASVEGAEADWNPADNEATLVAPLFELAELKSSIATPEHLDDANSAVARFTISNESNVSAPHPKARIQLSRARILGWDAPGWNCVKFEPGDLTCTAESLAPHGSSTIAVTAEFTAHEIRAVTRVTLSQMPADPGFQSVPQSFSADALFFRDYDVTTTADSGAGSLRQSILDANAECSGDQYPPPCRIAFRIPPPVPSEGWFTIEPLSELPFITVTDLTIDGVLQSALTGDSNRGGPEIFLRGNRAGDAEGLRLISGVESIHGLAIGGFSGNGILSLPRGGNIFLSAASFRHSIDGNYIGVDPGGVRPAPNALRGLMAYRFHGDIARNVISGNGRSGIYLVTAEDTTIADNRIGIAAGSDEAVPNGATGVFFLDTNPFQDVRIERNVIAYNAEYGISSVRSRFGIHANTIVRNRTAIDLGLDGPTPALFSGYIAPSPAISSARFDATDGSTTIEGTIERQSPWSAYPSSQTAYLYANTTATEEGEEFLGTTPVDVTGHFSLVVKKDLRNRFITGTTYMTIDYGDLFVRMSSEFGRVVAVE